MEAEQKKQLVKTVVKFAVGAVFSTLIGYTYKAGKLVEERIDDHFAPEIETTTQQED